MARRIVIGAVGFTVVGIGVAMIVLPGPAFVVIPAGLGILSLEFAFAKRWLEHVRTHGSRALSRFDRGARGDMPKTPESPRENARSA